MLDNERMMTTREVAHILHVHVNTVRYWSKKGLIKTYRLGPRGDRRFKRKDLESFLKEQSRKKS